MDLSIFSSDNMILASAGTITTLAGAAYAVLKVLRELKKVKKAETDRLIEECKELDSILRGKLEVRINILETQLHGLEASVNKDISNLKENHTLELKNLSDRIENLRDDLRGQHSQILNLLTKLVG
jgi:hypothetical protein